MEFEPGVVSVRDKTGATACQDAHDMGNVAVEEWLRPIEVAFFQVRRACSHRACALLAIGAGPGTITVRTPWWPCVHAQSQAREQPRKMVSSSLTVAPNPTWPTLAAGDAALMQDLLAEGLVALPHPLVEQALQQHGGQRPPSERAASVSVASPSGMGLHGRRSSELSAGLLSPGTASTGRRLSNSSTAAHLTAGTVRARRPPARMASSASIHSSNRNRGRLGAYRTGGHGGGDDDDDDDEEEDEEERAIREAQEAQIRQELLNRQRLPSGDANKRVSYELLSPAARAPPAADGAPRGASDEGTRGASDEGTGGAGARYQPHRLPRRSSMAPPESSNGQSSPSRSAMRRHLVLDVHDGGGGGGGAEDERAEVDAASDGAPIRRQGTGASTRGAELVARPLLRVDESGAGQARGGRVEQWLDDALSDALMGSNAAHLDLAQPSPATIDKLITKASKVWQAMPGIDELHAVAEDGATPLAAGDSVRRVSSSAADSTAAVATAAGIRAVQLPAAAGSTGGRAAASASPVPKLDLGALRLADAPGGLQAGAQPDAAAPPQAMLGAGVGRLGLELAMPQPSVLPNSSRPGTQQHPGGRAGGGAAAHSAT